MQKVAIFGCRALVGLFWATVFNAGLEAAPDFKIRYNPKFPCLEVMDSKAVKITDISEGTKGEVVTSGKASLKFSFVKNESGQPEVTMTEAKSTLSEMELEAFGLSVGMKPEGVVTVRFGADNKPQFEMDRTGGARFLMADLGNLDTAAGKEVTAAQPGAVPAGPSKGLLRFQERLSAWKAKAGKGGWSNRPGKVLACGKKSIIQYAGQAPRPLLDGEPIQIGAEVTVGADAPVTFQSGPGIFQKALPGTKFSLAPLEAGQKDLKVTLLEGTLLTMVMEPLVAPRKNLLGLGNGVVVQTADASYQAVKSGADTQFSVSAGSLRLVEEAGAAQLAQVATGSTYNWPNPQAAGKLVPGSPEAVSLRQLAEDAAGDYLVDMVEDAIKAASADAEEILREGFQADPKFVRKIAMEVMDIRPDLHGLISKTSGIADLPAPADFNADTAAFMKRSTPWLRGEPSPSKSTGKVLRVEGKATYADGLPVTRSMILKPGETVKTGGNGRVLFVAAPGAIAEIQPGSTVKLVEMKSRFEQGNLLESRTVLDVPQGRAFLSIAKNLGDKVQAEIRTPQGTAKTQSGSTDKTL